MEHARSSECPMCGSLMGAEAQPAAMRKAAEIQDQIDRLERRLRETERESWTVSVAVVCTPCQQVLVASSSGPNPDLARGVRSRIQELQREHADIERRLA
jgi:hypothetical protein